MSGAPSQRQSRRPRAVPSSYLATRGQWLPLALTLGVATVGAVWAYKWWTAATQISGSRLDDLTDDEYDASFTRTKDASRMTDAHDRDGRPARQDTVTEQGTDYSSLSTATQAVHKARTSKRTVAVVISARNGSDHSQAQEILHSLSQCRHVGNLLVMIYAPRDTTPTLNTKPSTEPHDSNSTHISTDLNALCNLGAQAARLVQVEEMVMTFASSMGHVHMLRHLKPENVYIQSVVELVGEHGMHVKALRDWVGRVDLVGRIDLDEDIFVGDVAGSIRVEELAPAIENL